jgi:hypothetical protein
MPSASIMSDFQRSSSNSSLSSSSLLLPVGQATYDIHDLPFRFEHQQKLSSPPSLLLSATLNDASGKKSQNMTECVPVPSSEHVAEIVGRQGKLSSMGKYLTIDLSFVPSLSLSLSIGICLGCKIKALRTKTNTYIKTPVRGDQPVFIITGRKEDVYIAKKEILSAADHFSQIRAGKITFHYRSCSILIVEYRFSSTKTANKH